MAERDYLAATRERVVVFDGGMGATLEQFDLTQEDYGGLQGKCHEALVLNRPDVIEGVHASMLEAGAEVVETDSFQGSRLKLEEWGLGQHTLEINTKAAEIARKAAGEERFVAGSIGPTGFLPASTDPTLGDISFGRLVEVFAEQARGLVEGGADLIMIETAQDILEVKAAIFGAREAFAETGRALPIQCSVSLLPNGGKMLLGTDIRSVLTTRRTCATRSASSARTRRCRCTASPMPACRCRAPTARRSSPKSPSPWRRRWASSSSATGSASSAAAAGRRRSTSPRSASGWTAAPPASARRRDRSRSPR
jgi:methionine synthase I (cobalamin-dependent)